MACPEITALLFIQTPIAGLQLTTSAPAIPLTNMSQRDMNNEEIITQLTNIVAQGGPRVEEYDQLDYLVGQVSQRISGNDFRTEDLGRLKQQCGFLNDVESIMGHIRLKPHGYAGDYSIIDRIYTHAASANNHKWDLYSLANSAAVAVRNRKEYFKTRATHKLQGGGKLLNVASGPARDLFEFYGSTRQGDVHTTCVEMDADAVAYATQLNAAYNDGIRFINKNIFRFQTDETFNVIWSAGLFDYFDDKAFVLLLRRFGKWLAPGGEIIIGNFNESCNPSRAYMEYFGEWYLNHRTEEQLLALAVAAGFDSEEVHIGREPENVNLFLHIQPRQ